MNRAGRCKISAADSFRTFDHDRTILEPTLVWSGGVIRDRDSLEAQGDLSTSVANRVGATSSCQRHWYCTSSRSDFWRGYRRGCGTSGCRSLCRRGWSVEQAKTVAAQVFGRPGVIFGTLFMSAAHSSATLVLVWQRSR